MARVAAFLTDAAREDGDAIAVAHLGVLRAAYTLATGWDMATPMPRGAGCLQGADPGAGCATASPRIHALNVELRDGSRPRTA